MKLQNKFAIGCLVQFYEIEIIEDYLKSLARSLEDIENPKNVHIDILFNTNQELEKLDTKQIEMYEITERFKDILNRQFGYIDEMNCASHPSFTFKTNSLQGRKGIYTIADYRRDFNDEYCEKVDVLMWGESDSLIPKETWEINDYLHTAVKEQTPKYVSFFATCKMWDDTWKVLEHPEFTDKPFEENDDDKWWSNRYCMTQKEMEEINNRTEELDVQQTYQLKFNGCGLVISSDVIKSGANIPKSVFFVHEDTAFMNNCYIHFNKQLPQYIIKNILLVHNRKLPKKRSYIKGQDFSDGDMTRMRKQQYWFPNADKMSQKNAFNTNINSYTYTWDDVFREFENE